MKVSDLEGAQLDCWVAKALGDRLARVVGEEEHERCETRFGEQWPWNRFMPSRAWMDGGPIIERECITLVCWEKEKWSAYVGEQQTYPDVAPNWDEDGRGVAALVVTMRAYLASKFGDEVPDENISQEGL